KVSDDSYHKGGGNKQSAIKLYFLGPRKPDERTRNEEKKRHVYSIHNEKGYTGGYKPKKWQHQPGCDYENSHYGSFFGHENSASTTGKNNEPHGPGKDFQSIAQYLPPKN